MPCGIRNASLFLVKQPSELLDHRPAQLLGVHDCDGTFVIARDVMPYADGNYRSIGLADMAHAIASNRPHRASGDLALHVLEVMEAFETSSQSGRVVDITTPVERPAPLSQSLVNGRLG